MLVTRSVDPTRVDTSSPDSKIAPATWYGSPPPTMISHDPVCWRVEIRRCCTPETWPRSVFRSVVDPVETACPACMTRARYCSAVSAAAPEVPGVGFAQRSDTVEGTEVTMVVTEFVGTAQEPVVGETQKTVT